MKRRILSMLLTLTMVISLVPGLTVAASAEGVEYIEHVDVTLNLANLSDMIEGDTVPNDSFYDAASVVDATGIYGTEASWLVKISEDNVNELVHPYFISAVDPDGEMDSQDLFEAVTEEYGVWAWAGAELMKPGYQLQDGDVYGLMIFVYAKASGDPMYSFTESVAVTLDSNPVASEDVTLDGYSGIYTTIGFCAEVGTIVGTDEAVWVFGAAGNDSPDYSTPAGAGDLLDAFDAATNGANSGNAAIYIKLQKDVSIEGNFYIGDAVVDDLVIDLGGNKLTMVSETSAIRSDEKNLSLKNGVVDITVNGDEYDAGLKAGGSGAIKLDSVELEIASNAFGIFGGSNGLVLNNTVCEITAAEKVFAGFDEEGTITVSGANLSVMYNVDKETAAANPKEVGQIDPNDDYKYFAIEGESEATSGIYPYGQDMTKTKLTLHIDAAGEAYQWQVAHAADSYFWKNLEIEGVNTAANSITFTPARDKWYRCVVDGVPSEAVQTIKEGATEYTFTKANGGQWYLSNGSMAYFTSPWTIPSESEYGGGSAIEAQVFDVVGKYTVSGGNTYWANTSYNRYWHIGAEDMPESGDGDYYNENIESIILNFDVDNDRYVRVAAKLDSGHTAAAFGTDTMLGTSITSGSYSDSCSLKAIFADGTLKQIQMVAAESLAKADPDKSLAMVITPLTPEAIFWIGAYGQAYIGEAYSYNEGASSYNQYYLKEGPGDYANYVTEIQGKDSALALSWTDLTTDTIQFIFSVGTIAEAGAYISGLDEPDGSIYVTAGDTATIYIKKDGVTLDVGEYYTREDTESGIKITFDGAAAITCESVLQVGIQPFGGSITWKTIANNIPHTYDPNNWVKDDAQHQQVCTVCERKSTPAGHSYVNGVCVCGQPEPAPAPTPTPPPSRPSSGGSYTPPTVDIPMSNDENKVDVKAEVSGKDATIKPLSNQQIEELVGDEAASGDVVVDLSDLGKAIDTAGIPKATLEAIVDAAEDAGNATEHLVIKLTTAELKLDDAAMRAIVDQADGNIIKFNFDDVGTERLNYKQKEAVKDMDVRKGFEAYITVNGQRISDFKGGNVEITVPYEVPAGESLAAYSVWYIDEQGNPEKLKSTYDGKNNWFVVTHFSDYVIAYNKADADVTGCPKDETCPIDPFTDTKNRAWYHNGVHYCIENGLMVGNGSDLFQPNGITTRAQIVTILWRMEGSPMVEDAKAFDDVAAKKWYYNAVRWASANEIVEGYDNGLFAPNDSITREQLAAILYRYCQYKGIDVSVGEETNILSYEDAIGIRKWAIPGLQWACGSGMIQGIEKNGTMYLDPKGSAVRSQSATIIYRLCTELYK